MLSAAFYFDAMLGLQQEASAKASRLAAENKRLREAMVVARDRLHLACREGTDTTDAEEACGVYYGHIGDAIAAIDLGLTPSA